MPISHHGLHHMHKRKRQAKKLDPYPHPNKWVRLIDHLIYVFAIVIPLTTIPQMVKIWVNKSAHDVSIVMWSAFLVSAVMWLLYAIVHKDRPLIINSVLWVAFEIVVITEIIVYG